MWGRRRFDRPPRALDRTELLTRPGDLISLLFGAPKSGISFGVGYSVWYTVDTVAKSRPN